MSKGSSGLFAGTNGSQSDFFQSLENKFSKLSNENTADVWNHVNATQENYGGTVIPKSFEIDVPITKATPDGKLWTHGNATEHMYESVTSINNRAPSIINSNPHLFSQLILYDYYKSLGKAVSKGTQYGSKVTIDSWEFIIVPSRDGGKYPVVKHALFTGLKKRG